MKKLLFTLPILLIAMFVVPQASFAQSSEISTPSYAPSTSSSSLDTTPTPSSNTQAHSAYPLNANPDVPNNLNTYTQSVLIELLASATCIVSGYNVLSIDGRCLGIDPINKKIGYVNANQSIGLLGTMGGLISSTYSLPANTGTFVQYMASNFGITRTATAQEEDPCAGITQPEAYNECLRNLASSPGGSSEGGLGKGIGFAGLKPVLQIWTVFRNLAYLAFVLLFVVIGLGIMFRLNIDARVVMSFQNQIPKIIIALVFITFSYAIAGFLIDLMYLSIYLMVNIFVSNNLATINDMSNPINAVGSFGGIHNIAEPAADGVAEMVGSIFEGSYGNNVAKIVVGVVGGMLGGTGGGITGLIGQFGKTLGPVAGTGVTIGTMALTGIIGGFIGSAYGPNILQYVAGIIAYLIITIAVISALFRTWIMLIKAYVFILLDVIFAPFFIMAGLLPGSPGGGFSSWIRSMLGNLAAFPTVITLFLVGAAIQSNLDSNSVDNFVPPLVGSAGDDSVRNIGAIIGLGIILIMPESVNIAKSMFKSPDRKLANSVFQPIGAGTGALKKFVGTPIAKAWRKESDGTRGFLRAGFEDKASNIAKEHLRLNTIATKISLVGRIQAGIERNRKENLNRRIERTTGKRPDSVSETENQTVQVSTPKPDSTATEAAPSDDSSKA